MNLTGISLAKLFIVIIVGIFGYLTFSMSFSKTLCAPKPPLHNCDRRKKASNKQVSTLFPGRNIDEFISQTPKDQLHIITNYIVLFKKKRKKLKVGKYRFNSSQNITLDEALILRDKELQIVLQRNLLHPRVAAVHILYSRDVTPKHISKMILVKSHKLILKKVDKDPTYAHAMNYAATHLIGRPVIFMNQDIYLEQGWEKLNHNVMIKKRIMYALSRHAVPGGECNNEHTCDKGKHDSGSYDAFAFAIDKPFPNGAFDMVDAKSDSLGLENVLVWLFRYKLNFTVMNPCKTLYIYHYHCIDLHNRQRIRYNNKGHSGRAKFTYKLQ